MGRRDINEKRNKLNLFKVFIVLILFIAVVVGIYFLIKNIGKEAPTNEDYDQKIEEALVEEITEEKSKTIEEILAEFGGEITEQVRTDTYYVTKDGVEYTVYLDGEIVEGRISPWDGNSNKPAVDEAGNINIYRADELKWIADQVISGEKNFSGVTITLRSNIDLGARKNEEGVWEGISWTPIIGFLDELSETTEETTEDNSNESDTSSEDIISEQLQVDDSIEITQENLKRFAGVFDGNGFSIRGMSIEADKRYQGLFGYNAGEILNLTIKFSNVKGNEGTGAIAGLNEGRIRNCNIENVTVKGEEKIGGIVGISMTGSLIENCEVNGDNCYIYANKYAGGLVGYMNNNSTILNSVNRANVTGTDCVGGVVGIIFYGSTISSCSNIAINVVGENYVGGIAGYSQAQIENSYNQENTTSKGVVSGKNYVGGIVGLNYLMGNITDSYNSGKIIVSEDNAGGIAGLNNATISNCYNNREIDSSEATGEKIGGICGQNLSDSFIYTSYNVGKMNSNYASGLVGVNFGNISSCFYLDSVSEQEDDEYKKSENEMKNDIISVLGESFKSDDNNLNSGYPILTWQSVIDESENI